MEKVKYRYNRWRLALGRLVNLRYINRWIIFCADLFISLCVSLIGVLGLLSIMHVYINGISVLKVGIASFVASILSFLTFKVYHGVIRHSTLRGLWRIGGVRHRFRAVPVVRAENGRHFLTFQEDTPVLK